MKLKDNKVHVVVKEEWDIHDYMENYSILRIFKDIKDANLFVSEKEKDRRVEYKIVTMIVD